MSGWYSKIIQDQNDLSPVLDACDYFEKEYQEARAEVDMKNLRGQTVKSVQLQLPGIIGYRVGQLREIEAIVEYLDLRLTAIKGARRKHFTEHYNRALSSTVVEKYVEADDDVVTFAMLLNQVRLVQGKFDALSRQHECLHYQLTNTTKLIVAGADDALL